jgi:DNA-binding beta-propeller fold protein YncE
VRRVEARTGIITTVAGTGVWGYATPGKLALASPLHYPGGVAVNVNGDLYISDTYNHRVIRVDGVTSLFEVFAGNGQEGFSGDGGAATDASLKSPGTLLLDMKGNLFISDSSNRRVRRVDADTRIITTVAGNGEYCRTCIPEFPDTCEPCDRGDGGLATEARLGSPRGLAIDPTGNLYIVADNRVRMVDTDTGIITTVAGGGEPVDGLGDGGPAQDAALDRSTGLGLDTKGNLYIGQRDRVRKVDLATGIIDTVIERLGRVGSVSADMAGNIYFSDMNANQVFAFDSIRALDPASGPAKSLIAGVGEQDIGDGGLAVAASTRFPVAVETTSDGTLWFGEDISGRVRIVDPQDHTIRTVYRTACSITDLTVNRAGTACISENCYGETGGSLIRAFDMASGLVRNLVEGGPGNLHSVFAANGDLYFSSENRILRMDWVTGQIYAIAGTGEDGFSGDGGPALEAGLGSPGSLTFDDSGNLFFVDSGRIRMVDAGTQVISTVAGNGGSGFTVDGGQATEASLAWIKGIAIDDSGNLYISEMGSHRVRRVNLASGVLTTAVGTGSCHIRGDGGLATAADVCAPHGLAIDGGGNLYIADRSNQLVRAVRRPVN